MTFVLIVGFVLIFLIGLILYLALTEAGIIHVHTYKLIYVTMTTDRKYFLEYYRCKCGKEGVTRKRNTDG